MSPRALRKMDSGRQMLPVFIPTFSKGRWDIEAATWAHLSGSSPRLAEVREEAKLGMKNDGLDEIVAEFNSDEERFALIYSRGLSAT